MVSLSNSTWRTSETWHGHIVPKVEVETNLTRADEDLDTATLTFCKQMFRPTLNGNFSKSASVLQARRDLSFRDWKRKAMWALTLLDSPLLPKQDDGASGVPNLA